MRNVFIIILWALLLALGIVTYALYHKGVRSDEAMKSSQTELASLQEENGRMMQKAEAAAKTISELEASIQELTAELQATRD